MTQTAEEILVAAHTPLPWKVFRTKDGNLLLGIGSAKTSVGVTDAAGGLWGMPREAIANAEYAVRAVNSYEAMRSALVNIEEYWNRDQNEQAMADALWHIIATASEALKATEENGNG